MKRTHLFDSYLIVDWSGGNTRRSNRADCIWIASGEHGAKEPETTSYPSRTDAMRFIKAQIENQIKSNMRSLATFDFAFGYPVGFSRLLQPSNLSASWETVWKYLSHHLKDDIDSRKVPSNRSNRFDVANKINELLSTNGIGPFWCVDPNWRRKTKIVYIPQNKPGRLTLNMAHISIAQSRETDAHVTGCSPFCLFRVGSVGSQSLTGIPRLQWLREQFSDTIRIWPFQTGWAVGDEWHRNLSDSTVLLAEIYPSVQEPLPDAIKDRGQVRAMWHWARDLDAKGQLLDRFRRPREIKETDDAILREEGWILR